MSEHNAQIQTDDYYDESVKGDEYDDLLDDLNESEVLIFYLFIFI